MARSVAPVFALEVSDRLSEAPAWRDLTLATSAFSTVLEVVGAAFGGRHFEACDPAALHSALADAPAPSARWCAFVLSPAAVAACRSDVSVHSWLFGSGDRALRGPVVLALHDRRAGGLRSATPAEVARMPAELARPALELLDDARRAAWAVRPPPSPPPSKPLRVRGRFHDCSGPPPKRKTRAPRPEATQQASFSLETPDA